MAIVPRDPHPKFLDPIIRYDLVCAGIAVALFVGFFGILFGAADHWSVIARIPPHNWILGVRAAAAANLVIAITRPSLNGRSYESVTGRVTAIVMSIVVWVFTMSVGFSSTSGR